MLFRSTFIQEDLVNLSKFEVYLKLMIDGVTSEAFSARTLPPVVSTENSGAIREKVIKISRERYSKSREAIEEKITRWSEDKGEDETAGPINTKSVPVRPKSDVVTKVNCTYCGIDTEVKFIPDPSRPVYCKDCLKLSRAGKIPSPASIKIVDQNKPEKNKEEFTSLSEALSTNRRTNPPRIINKTPARQAGMAGGDKTSGNKSLKPGQVVKF